MQYGAVQTERLAEKQDKWDDDVDEQLVMHVMNDMES